MGFLKFTNNAKSTLTAGISAAALSLTVQTGEGAEFPVLLTGDHFYATLQDTSGNLEIVKVTARVSDTFTIVRAQDGTTARAFATGDSIGCRINKAAIDELTADTAVYNALVMG